MQSNVKNNIVSVQDDDLKSTFYQPMFCGTRHKQPVCRDGTSASTCPTHLTGYTGHHCGQPCLSKSSSTFGVGFYNGCTTDDTVKMSLTSVTATHSRSHAVCDKAAFLVHGYFVLFWNLPCENAFDKLASI